MGAQEAGREEDESAGLVCPCGPDAPLEAMLAVSVAAGDVAPEEVEAILAAARAAPVTALPAGGGRAPPRAAVGDGGAVPLHAADAPEQPGGVSLGVGMDVGVEGGAAVAASGGAAPGVEWLAARFAVSWVPAPCVGAGPSVAVVPACSPVGLVGAEGELEERRAKASPHMVQNE